MTGVVRVVPTQGSVNVRAQSMVFTGPLAESVLVIL
jgi:hypothetical protein